MLNMKNLSKRMYGLWHYTKDDKTDVLPKTYVLFIVLTVFLGPRPGALPLSEHINV